MVKRKKPIIAELKDPIFGLRVHLVADATTDQLRDFMKKHDLEDNMVDEFNAGTVFYVENPKVREIYCICYLENSKDTSTIVHEAHHLATDTCKKVGIPVNERNDEVTAYLQDYWVKELKHAIEKGRKKKSLIDKLNPFK